MSVPLSNNVNTEVKDNSNIETVPLPSQPSSAQSLLTPLPNTGTNQGPHTSYGPVTDKLIQLLINSIGISEVSNRANVLLDSSQTASRYDPIAKFPDGVRLDQIPDVVVKDIKEVGYIDIGEPINLSPALGIKFRNLNEIECVATIIYQKAINIGDVSILSAYQISTDITQYLIESSLPFSAGLGFAQLELNKRIIEKFDVSLDDGILRGPKIIPSMAISSEGIPGGGADLLEMLTGVLITTICISENFNCVVYIDKGDALTVSLSDQATIFPFLNHRFLRGVDPNPAIMRSLSRRSYFYECFEGSYQNFRIGIVGATAAINRVATKSKWAITKDNVTIHLLGISARYYENFQVQKSVISAVIQCHSLPNTTVIIPSDKLEYSRKLLVPNAESALSTISYSLCRIPSLRTNILQSYIDYFTAFGLFNSKPIDLDDSNLVSVTPSVRTSFRYMIAQGNFSDLITSLVLQVSPTLVFPDLVSEYKSDPIPAIMYLYETLLYFVLFPKTAKFVGYELANRIKVFFESFCSTIWGNYVNTLGFIRGSIGVNDACERIPYLNGEQIPNLFLGPNANTNPGVDPIFSRIADVIIPIGTDVTPPLPRIAQEPRFETSCFLPYASLPRAFGAANPVKLRLQLIAELISSIIQMLVKTNTLVSTLKSSAHILNNVIKAKAADVSIGTGVARAILNPMMSFYTNITQNYDGHLSTKIPGPIFLFDNKGSGGCLPMQDVSTNFQITTQVVWTLFFGTEYIFDSPSRGTDIKNDTIKVSPLPPLETLNSQLAILEFAQRFSIPAGLVHLCFLDLNVGASVGIRRIRELLYTQSTVPLTATTYRRLEEVTLNAYNKFRPFKSEGETITGSSLPTNVGMPGDYRFMEPILKRGDFVGNAVYSPNDIPLLNRPLVLLNQRDRETFIYCMNFLMDPNSQLSRLGQGIGLQRQKFLNVSYDHIFILRFQDTIYLNRSNFVQEMRPELQGYIGGFKVEGSDVIHTDALSFPELTIIIEDPSLFSSDELNLIASGVQNGKFDVMLPNAKFSYSIQYIRREEYVEILRKIDLLSVLQLASTSIVKLSLYQTYSFVMNTTTITTQNLYGYVFPMNPIDVPVIARDMISVEKSEDFIGPSSNIYDTGNLSSSWYNTYTNGSPKDYTNISLSNEVHVYERGAGLFDTEPEVNVRVPSVLEVFLP